jgi:hypothetical protein
MYYTALPAHALHSAEVMVQSVSNVGHVILEANTVHRLYLPSYWSGVIEICNMALPAHALPAVHVWLESLINEGHFTIETDRVFRP